MRQEEYEPRVWHEKLADKLHVWPKAIASRWSWYEMLAEYRMPGANEV